MSVRERRLLRGGQCVILPPKAFDALHLMVRRHESLVSRAEIFSTLWPGIHVSEANLTNVIVVLRKALGRDSIQTVSKFGYRFTLPVTGEPGVAQAAYKSFVRGKELLAERSPDSSVSSMKPSVLKRVHQSYCARRSGLNPAGYTPKGSWRPAKNGTWHNPNSNLASYFRSLRSVNRHPGRYSLFEGPGRFRGEDSRKVRVGDDPLATRDL